MPQPLLFAIAFSYCAGIITGEYWRVPEIGLIIFGLLIVIFWLVKKRPTAVVLLALALGLLNVNARTAAPVNVPADQQLVSMHGTIVEQPQVWYGQATIIIESVINGEKQKYSVTLPDEDYAIGQVVDGQCVWQAPEIKELSRDRVQGITGQCESDKSWSVVGHKKNWRLRLSQFNVNLQSLIDRGFRSPQDDLLAGILLGAKRNMSAELRQQFQATGTSHIVALSGYNVSIIVTVILNFCIRLVGRRYAWIPAVTIVVGFVIMTGASASVVRAAVMACMAQIGLVLGRPVAPMRALAYTALVMLWQNPLILRHDLGFQLSFLATSGLVLLVDPIATKLSWLTDRFSLRSNLSSTLAAILSTEPLLIAIFGRWSLVAPLVNAAVLPLVPLSMALGALYVGLSAINHALATLVVPLSDLILRAILGVISIGAHWRWALVSYTWWTPVFVAILVAITIKLYASSPDRHPS